MQLDEAIRAWGSAHRSELDDAEREALGTLYRRVRDTGHGSLDITAMTKEHARSVMLEFDKPDRAEIAQRLNRVRRWVLEGHAEHVPDHAVAPRAEPALDAGPEPDREDRPVSTTPEGSADLGLDDDEVESVDPTDIAALAADRDDPPLATPDEARRDRRAIALIGLAVVVLIVVGFIALNADTEEVPVIDRGPVSIEEPAETEGEEQSPSEFLLNELGVDEELGRCLTDELGDLVSAATDSERLIQPVCGTTLAEVIAGNG